MHAATVENAVVFHVAATGVVSNGAHIAAVSSLTYANSLWLTPAEADWLEFSELAAAWKKETQHLSMLRKVFGSPHYARILAMGANRVVPLIIRQLALEDARPYHWFAPLVALTNENPAPATENNVREIAKAWIEWGRVRYAGQLGSK
jgi:hypothetical protein